MWILPTLSRPDNCREILRRIKDSGGKSEGVVFVNGVSHRKEYIDMHVNPSSGFPKQGWSVYYGDENLGCIGALNEVFRLYPNEPFYGFMGDDEFLIEGNPDDVVKAAGSWDIAHGNENWNHGKRFQGYCVMGGDLARAVGYLGIPDCWHHFGFDCMWEWLCANPAFGGGGACRNILVPEVVIEHRHYKLDLAQKDGCYAAADGSFESDKRVFWHWIMKRMPEVVERIKQLRLTVD